MNVIAWDRAYSLYPRATLVDRSTLNTRGEHNEIPYKYDYRERGWACYRSEDFLGDEYPWFLPAFSTDMRWIGDGQSWTIKLPVDGITPPPAANSRSLALSRDPCAGTAWHLAIWIEENDTTVLHKRERRRCDIDMHFKVSKRKCFKYGYVYTGYKDRDLDDEILTLLENPIYADVISEYAEDSGVEPKR